eukprot:25497_1
MIFDKSDQPNMEMVVQDSKGLKDSSDSKTNDQTQSLASRGSDPDDKPLPRRLKILVFCSRALPIVAAVCGLGYLIVLLSSPDNWSTDPNSTDSEILDREASRGLFVSVLIAVLLNCIGAFMFWLRVRESLVVINYGFILGPVIGFMLDQGIGTDAGFKDFGTAAGFSYTFSSLIGGNFLRYIITVFLDLFISNPLQDVLKFQAVKLGVIEVLKKKNKHKYLLKYDAFVAMNYPSILQSIIAVITFNAYTNQTRFAWAYPALTLDRVYRIPPGTMMLATAIAGVLYLNFYTIMDYISERQYFDVNTKILYVVLILGLLYGLNQTESMEAPVLGEADKEYTKSIKSAKPYLGMLMLTFFILYGFVYPLWTKVGCCGKWKPKEIGLDGHAYDDHMALTMTDDQAALRRKMTPSLSKAQAEDIKKLIRTELDLLKKGKVYNL